MQLKMPVLLMCLAVSKLAAGDAQTPDGVLTWTAPSAAARVTGEISLPRWGMYDAEALLGAPAAGKIKGSIGSAEFSAVSGAANAAVKLGRIYLEKSGKVPVLLEAEPGDAANVLTIKALVLTPAPEGKAIVQDDDLSITLHARDATVHGNGLRYEKKPEKNTLGFWGNAKDWVSWDFDVKKPGKFIVFAMHGSGGGSEMEIAVGEQKLNWTTKNTGGFHTFTFLEAGTLTLDAAGPVTLTLKPVKKTGGAVMDLRQLVLVPVLK